MPTLIPSLSLRFTYELLHRWAHAKGYSLFNIGYGPVEAEIANDRRFSADAYQVQLYLELAKFGDLAELDSTRPHILEVGCGCGGGIRFLQARLPMTELRGVDNAKSAVGICRKIGVDAQVAGADKLPFKNNALDCVLCVDSFSVFPHDAFLAESYRVIKPGGMVLIGDYLNSKIDDIRDELDALATRSGFQLESFEDASSGVLRALEGDQSRKFGIVKALPKILHGPLTETLSLPGSKRYQSWQEGHTCYYMALLRHP